VLLQERGVSLEDPPARIEWNRFPVTAMAKLGWIPKVKNLESRARELVGDLIRRAGGPTVAAAALYRKNDLRPRQCQDGSLRTDGLVL
jgi:hypothetical protein